MKEIKQIDKKQEILEEVLLLSKINKLDKLITKKQNSNKILYYNKGKKIHCKQLEFANVLQKIDGYLVVIAVERQNVVR
ncbi:MAG: hypothetical protein FWF56_01675 [Firmicutes bacterium]|nr:hypothetical protein [Bacillota bacterium]MCL1953264.1 hypothetical protein [Bacillota bacterium]